ncbi:MAG: radical SAM/SPASM domain-containing protein [Pseudomonadota bacterium]
MLVKEISKFGFDIVHGCQLRCVGCPNSTLKPKIKQILPADFYQCLCNVDVAHVNLFRLFNFGEPLLHDKLPDILLQIPRQTWTVKIVEISTNAQYHDFDMMIEILKSGVINRIAASCDGDGTAEDYERLRPPGKWEKFIEFLRRVHELRDMYAPNVVLINRIVCTEPGARERWLGVVKPLGWTPEFREWLILPGGGNMTGRQPVVPSRICSYLSQPTVYADYDGTVVPCCVHPRAGVLGNLMHNTLSEILAGQARAKMLGAMQNNRMSMPICGECEF